MSLEEPEYTILKQTAEYEIRKYGDRLAVEAFETGGEDRAFSLLSVSYTHLTLPPKA